MKRRVTAMLMCICMGMSGAVTVTATEFTSGVSTEVFVDGPDEVGTAKSETGDLSAMANSLVAKTEEEAQKYLEEKAAAQEKRIEEAYRKAEEMRALVKEEMARIAEEERLEQERLAEEARLAKRQELVDFALQFEGNPYVYGGTSLTNGADCSGFVLSVFKEFGYELPRVAAAQYESSTKKDLSEMEVGDLLFYGGGITHVAIYIGDGQIIHASTSASGIKVSNYDYEMPVAVGTYLE